MQVFRALQVLVLLIFVAFTQAKTEESPKNATEEASKSLDPTLVQPDDQTDAIRKKKSATTTLCVEIRPSGPYQRPFQICEPAESKPYAAPAPQGYYPAPAYEEVKPAATPKPAPAYEAPAKVYSAPAKPTSAPAYGSSKPYAAHSPSSYSSVSYRSDDGMAEMPEEEEEHSDELMDHARSAGQEYGLPMTYLQPALKHKAKKGHNGLVITCQPSLAGYAATIPSHGPSYGAGPYGGGNMGGYGGYRSSMSRSSYGRYERPSPPRGYGGYAPAPAPVYKVPPPPSYYKPSYSAPSYSAPVYKPAPAYKPAPSYSAPAPAYSAPQPAYKPAPAPAYPEPSYQPAPAPQPSYQPAPAPQPSYQPAPAPQPSYQPAPAPQPSYQPAPAPQPTYQPAPAPAYAPKPHSPPPAPAYAPPPTYGPAPKPHGYPSPVGYREAEEAKMTQSSHVPSQEEKEKHTVEAMTQMTEARNMALEGKVKMPNPGWNINEEGDNKSNMAEEMRAAEDTNENKV
ncbi:uncharacterized protein LOC103314733 [Tribolium castaneum]|uniref:Extensin n=1 Tax=Tribolium castaneum TaxID=7070 RepID=D6X2W2_TRICA|nr:PREDICTED: extensin [Tribolium castaneum]EFA10634.1 hypothetical protein TcasGA2_TC016271 [Tribolium castaneum]|eukprot:XP_008199687.1 PREDICTED: extensin [Tribolium castaneum]